MTPDPLPRPSAALAAKARLLSGVSVNGGDAPSIDTIIRFTCATFGVSKREIVSCRRDASICLARHTGYWLARRLTRLSLPVIAMHFGNRDHTTILHGVRRIDGLIERDAGVRGVIEGMRDALRLPPEAA